LKIAPLLAQYLYNNGKLDLPGIGTFTLENPSTLTITDPKNKPVQLEGVNFIHNKSTAEDPDLIAYISAQTGKIKPLASSDLESHLELAKQFLNIGKPFLFEGIGTLSKKLSEYNFTSGTMIAEPVREHNIREAVQQQAAEESGGYSDVFYAKNKASKTAWVKPAIFLLVVAGLALAIWGGYTVYKNTSNKKEIDTTIDNASEVDTTQNNTTVATNMAGIDTLKIKKDSTATTSAIAAPAGSFKFILEQSDSIRANTRYTRLKKFGWNINIEKVDSAAYKLFMLLPANPADTARLVDSLSRLNGKRVIIQ
jgi:hypothetical protein